VPIEVADLPFFDMKEFADLGGRYATHMEARPLLKDTPKESKEALRKSLRRRQIQTRQGIKRMGEELQELPSWTERAERLKRFSMWNVPIPSLWGRGIYLGNFRVPGLRLVPLREARRQLRP